MRLFALLLWAAASLHAHADVVYHNLATDLGSRFSVGNREVGDEIVLAGTNRVLTSFEFRYWGTNAVASSFDGTVECRIRFYLNDASPGSFFPAPGTVIFDSDYFPVFASQRLPLIFDDFMTGAAVPLTRRLPNSFTWTIEFRGLGPGEDAGVELFSPPAIGTAFQDYWAKVGTDWILKNDLQSVNFGVLIEADPMPPAPTLSVRGAPAGQATLTWPAQPILYRLQETVVLTTVPSWNLHTNIPVRRDGLYSVVVPITGPQHFFRLVHP